MKKATLLLVALVLSSMARADVVTTTDDHVYQGKVQYQDADIVKMALAGSGEIRVFLLKDIKQVLVESSPAQGMTQPSGAPTFGELVEWEQKGLADGRSSLGLKTTFAGCGGCLLGSVGGVALGAPTALTAGGGGAVGCLGGWGAGYLGQRGATPPTESPAAHEAYMRGYSRGTSQSNTTALLVGGGATVLAIVASAVYLVSYIR